MTGEENKPVLFGVRLATVWAPRVSDDRRFLELVFAVGALSLPATLSELKKWSRLVSLPQRGGERVAVELSSVTDFGFARPNSSSDLTLSWSEFRFRWAMK